jgi:hypothetical protein
MKVQTIYVRAGESSQVKADPKKQRRTMQNAAADVNDAGLLYLGTGKKRQMLPISLMVTGLTLLYIRLVTGSHTDF